MQIDEIRVIEVGVRVECEGFLETVLEEILLGLILRIDCGALSPVQKLSRSLDIGESKEGAFFLLPEDDGAFVLGAGAECKTDKRQSERANSGEFFPCAPHSIASVAGRVVGCVVATVLRRNPCLSPPWA